MYLDLTKRGQAAEQDAQKIFIELNSQGRDANILDTGDQTQLPGQMTLGLKSEIAKVFGDGFVEHIFSVEAGI